MSFFKRLAGLFTPSPAPAQRDLYSLAVKCNRCGETIIATVDLRNDLSADYDEATGATTYVCRKVLMGRQRCFQQIETTLRFDAAHKLIDREITGGQFVEPAP
jgi:hypothetical protein